MATDLHRSNIFPKPNSILINTENTPTDMEHAQKCKFPKVTGLAVLIFH